MPISIDAKTWKLPSGYEGFGFSSSSDCVYVDKVWSLGTSWEYAKSMGDYHQISPSAKFGWPSFFGFVRALRIEFGASLPTP